MPTSQRSTLDTQPQAPPPPTHTHTHSPEIAKDPMTNSNSPLRAPLPPTRTPHQTMPPEIPLQPHVHPQCKPRGK